MFYPNVIYENLPYVYFLVSGYLIAYYHSWPVYISSAIFYCVGCIILVKRSDYRRVDRFKGNYQHLQRIPEVVYEYLPYSYFAIAMVILLKLDNQALQFTAIILLILALRNLLCRGNNRRKGKSPF